jgi:hypothetical protein
VSPNRAGISVEIPKQREAARWAFRVETYTYRFIDDFWDNMLRLSSCAIKSVLICADLRTSSWVSGHVLSISHVPVPILLDRFAVFDSKYIIHQ